MNFNYYDRHGDQVCTKLCICCNAWNRFDTKHKPKIVYLEQTGHYTFKSRNNNNSSSNNMIILNGEIDLFYLPADILETQSLSPLLWKFKFQLH